MIWMHSGAAEPTGTSVAAGAVGSGLAASADWAPTRPALAGGGCYRRLEAARALLLSPLVWGSMTPCLLVVMSSMARSDASTPSPVLPSGFRGFRVEKGKAREKAGESPKNSK